MDKIIRTLALDDDNHEDMFVTDTGRTFGCAQELLEFLGKPHTETYEFRWFCLIDYSGPAEELDESLVDNMFCYVGGFACQPNGYTFAEAFDILWASAKMRYRV